jgi:hypothetical protein
MANNFFPANHAVLEIVHKNMAQATGDNIKGHIRFAVLDGRPNESRSALISRALFGYPD